MGLASGFSNTHVTSVRCIRPPLCISGNASMSSQPLPAAAVDCTSQYAIILVGTVDQDPGGVHSAGWHEAWRRHSSSAA